MKPLRTWMPLLSALALLGCGGSNDDLSVAENAVANEAAPDIAAANEAADATPPEKEAASVEPTSACMVQDGNAIPDNAIHAIGTEPFWAADVEGRCVTYSTPENQAGTRVWTRFEGAADSWTWTGALGGKPFVMMTRPQQGCSDGMSDNAYPIAVELKVGGETRRGCAAPR